MVNSTSNQGLYDWIIQRITAIIIGIYTLFLLVYFFIHPHLTYSEWHDLFHHFLMKLATFVVMVSILWHGWIGLWTVFTDYVKPRYVRLVLETLVIILLLVCVAWVAEIMWG